MSEKLTHINIMLNKNNHIYILWFNPISFIKDMIESEETVSNNVFISGKLYL